MYGKPNKTEKRIIKAWKADSMDEAYNGLANSGWAADMTVFNHPEKGYCQHAPKVHPELVELLKGVPFGDKVSEWLGCGLVPVKRTTLPLSVDAADGCVRKVVLQYGDAMRVTFDSPVHAVCHDMLGKVWEIRLLHKDKPVIKVYE